LSNDKIEKWVLQDSLKLTGNNTELQKTFRRLTNIASGFDTILKGHGISGWGMYDDR
jgi:hypothetical protein